MLGKKRMFDDSINPVICVRKGSSLKDKNIRPYKNGKSLLEICVEKALKVFGSVTVLADDEHYCELAKSSGADSHQGIRTSTMNTCQQKSVSTYLPVSE